MKVISALCVLAFSTTVLSYGVPSNNYQSQSRPVPQVVQPPVVPLQQNVYSQPPQHFISPVPLPVQQNAQVLADTAVEEPINGDYNFSYSVNNPETGDVKSQEETKKGGVVTGVYKVLQPDGCTRTVEYIADSEGFHPTVVYTGPCESSQPPATPLPPANSPIFTFPAPAAPPVFTYPVQVPPARMPSIHPPIVNTIPFNTMNQQTRPAFEFQPFQQVQEVSNYNNMQPAQQVLEVSNYNNMQPAQQFQMKPVKTDALAFVQGEMPTGVVSIPVDAQQSEYPVNTPPPTPAYTTTTTPEPPVTTPIYPSQPIPQSQPIVYQSVQNPTVFSSALCSNIACHMHRQRLSQQQQQNSAQTVAMSFRNPPTFRHTSVKVSNTRFNGFNQAQQMNEQQ